MRLGIAITRASSVDTTWTTACLAEAALSRGHALRLVEPWDFEIDGTGRLVARAHAFDEPLSREAICEQLQQRTARRRYLEVAGLDVLLLRINPIDLAVLGYASLAARQGVLVLNTPETLIKTSHKSYLAQLDGVPRPKTLVTRSLATTMAFSQDLATGCILKPARASGGRAVSRVQRTDERRLERAFYEASRAGDGYVVVQEYLPAAEQGEKRLLWLDGDLLGGYLRRRAPGELAHNLKRGGQPEPCQLTESEHALIRTITPHLKADGVWFAGIDVIGGHVVEINTLNPGGVHLVQAFTGSDLAAPMVAWLEAAAVQR